MRSFIREACVDSLQQAIVAQRKGADRIELCANLELDGLTPSEDLISEVKKIISIPIRVMIRPRGGDFIYSEAEINEMKKSIEFCKKAGIEGVVFGILTPAKSWNIEAMKSLIEIAKPLKVIVHKAIDETPDPLKAFKELCKFGGVNTVLTSGGAKTATEGKTVLKEMIQFGSEKVEVMPAGKITDENIQKIHSLLNASAYHGKLIVGSLE